MITEDQLKEINNINEEIKELEEYLRSSEYVETRVALCNYMPNGDNGPTLTHETPDGQGKFYKNHQDIYQKINECFVSAVADKIAVLKNKKYELGVQG